VTTYHKIREFISGMAALSGRLRSQQELLPEVVRVLESMDRLNQSLCARSEQMARDIARMEALDELLRRHVYGRCDETSPECDGSTVIVARMPRDRARAATPETEPGLSAQPPGSA
jgi:hypothetical protein